MDEDEVFLRAMIASPEDAGLRLAYADWLDLHSDPRAQLLRSDWGMPRLSYVDWIATDGADVLEYYFGKHPDLRDQISELAANQWWRDKIDSLKNVVASDWLAVIDSLGRPFRPFFFWNNTGPRSYEAWKLPLRETIGARGSVITFESAFRGDAASQVGLKEDLHFLSQLKLPDCEYGAASCPMHPFVCALAQQERPLTGADVLQALKVADFKSQHIQTLERTCIPYPGYHPGTENDEIHNDSECQVLFPRLDDIPIEKDPYDFDTIAERRAVHDALQEVVVDRQLWYVLLHSRVRLVEEESYRCFWVLLFAVGQSARSGQLIGVVSHQVCHNLCD